MRDAVVLAARHAGRGWTSLGDLPAGAVLGTSSLRREAYIRGRHPHLRVASVRGNLQTRLAKLDDEGASSSSSGGGGSSAVDTGTGGNGGAGGVQPPAPGTTGAAASRAAAWTPADPPLAASGGTADVASAAAGSGTGSGALPLTATAAPPRYDALVLAAAGLHRLGWTPRISWLLPVEEAGTAVGQGALGLECRGGDAAVLAMLRAVSHGPTLAAVSAERAFLRALQGGCQVPIAVHTRLTAMAGAGAGGPRCVTLSIQGSVTALDGSEDVTSQASGVVPLWEPPREEEGGAGDAASWDAAVEAAAAAGRALAQRALDGGAGRILGPLTAARPATYGAAEVRFD